MTDTREGHGAMDDFFGVVDRLPYLGSLKRDLEQLRRLLYDRRAARVLVVGAEGSGRTALVNGLFGAASAEIEAPADRWVRIENAGRHLDWLEVVSGAPSAARLDALSAAIDESTPDVVVYVAQADAASGGPKAGEPEALVQAQAALSTLLDARNLKPRALVVLTKADRLIAEGARPPYDAARAGRIDAATAALKKKLDEGGLSLPRAIPCAALAPQEARWNLREVADELWARLPEQTHVEAVRALPVGQERRRELARIIANRAATIGVTIGLAPIPFSDAILLMPLQGMMVTGIAYVAGQPWDRRAALEWLGSVGLMGGAAMGLRWSAQQLLKLVPGAGTLVSASIAGAGTLAIGRSAIAYFIDGPGARGVKALLPATGTAIEPA
ncbi:MAG: hypothetical protein U0234_27310 [Sandaracinus sp.]